MPGSQMGGSPRRRRSGQRVTLLAFTITASGIDLIYALAAYSITLSVLGLYWVVLAHRSREFAEASARSTGLSVADPRRGINVGALLLAPLWLLRHGMVGSGAILGLLTLGLAPLYQQELWTPLLFLGMIPLSAAVALGFVGNRIAVGYTGLESPGAFSANQLPWAVAGIVLYTVGLPWAGYFFLTGFR